MDIEVIKLAADRLILLEFATLKRESNKKLSIKISRMKKFLRDSLHSSSFLAWRCHSFIPAVRT